MQNERYSGFNLFVLNVNKSSVCVQTGKRGLTAVAHVCLMLLPLLPFYCKAVNVPSPPQPLATWDATGRATTGFGYRENVLRSSIDQENGAFFNTSADVSLMRFLESGAYMSFFILFDDSQYFNTPSVDYERFISATLQAATPVGTDDELGGQFNCLYQHQVIDLSESQSDISRSLVDGYTYALQPYWKHTLGDGWDVQAETELLRQVYSGEISDYWAPAAGLRLIRRYGHRSEVSLYGQTKYLVYDSREKADPDGNALAGTSLVYQQNEIGIQWRHTFDKDQQWRTRTKLNYKLSQDNGSGYFDYHRVQGSQQLRWKNPLWEVKMNACLNWYTYPEQEIDNEHYDRYSVVLDVRIERRLGKRWILYSFAEREWSMSNDERDQYRDWAAGCGAGFEF